MKAKKTMMDKNIMKIVHKLEKNFYEIRVLVTYSDCEGEKYMIHVPKEYSKLRTFKKFESEICEKYFMKGITNFFIVDSKIEKTEINELVYVSPYVTADALFEVY